MGISQLVEGLIEQKVEEGGICPFYFLPACLTWHISSSPGLRLEFKPLALLVFGFSDLDWIIPLAFLVLHRVDGRLLNVSVSTVMWANDYISILLFLWRTLIHQTSTPPVIPSLLPPHFLWKTKQKYLQTLLNALWGDGGGGKSPSVENHWSRWKYPVPVELDVSEVSNVILFLPNWDK